MTRLEPVHPGEVLKYDFMEPFGLSATALAKAIGVTPARINEIVRGRRGITAEDRVAAGAVFQHRCPELDEPSRTATRLEVAERDKSDALRAIRPRDVA